LGSGQIEDGESVKRIIIAAWLIAVLIFTACQSSVQAPVPSSTPLPAETSTSQPKAVITPKITATPIVAKINTDDDLEYLVEQLYSIPCIGYNFAKAPQSDLNHASTLNFIEVDIQPDHNRYWVSEIADSADGSRQAFVACEPEFCQDKLYVSDEKTEKVYEIDWEARMPWRPIQWVTWINNDTLAFLQSSNPDHALLFAFNFEKKEVLYEAVVFPDYYCATLTPIP
jgi:hypothetical protein